MSELGYACQPPKKSSSTERKYLQRCHRVRRVLVEDIEAANHFHLNGLPVFQVILRILSETLQLLF